MSDESKASYVRARCTEEFKKKVEEFALDFGSSEGEIVRLALEEFIARNEAAQSIPIPKAVTELRRVSARTKKVEVTPETKAAIAGAAQVAKRTPRA